MSVHVQRTGETTIYVNMDDAAIASLASPGGMVDKYTKGVGGTVLVKIRQFAPVRSGRLRSQIKLRQAREVSGRFKSGWEVISEAPYSAFVSQGTPPHTILPVSASVLRFQVGGTTVFARRVNHPGTKPNDFMERGLAAGVSTRR